MVVIKFRGVTRFAALVFHIFVVVVYVVFMCVCCCLQLFTGVFGVGPGTAKKWISNGLSSIEDAIKATHLHRKDDRVYIGQN